MNLRDIRGMAISTVLGLFGLVASPSNAQEGLCGTHTVPDLLLHYVGSYPAQLIDGVTYGREVEDMAASAELYPVGDGFGFAILAGGGMPRLEVDLTRVNAADALDFSGAGFGADLDDIAIVSGCDSSAEFPQYFGSGAWLGDDGQRFPTTLRLLIWLGTAEGSGETQLSAVGVVRGVITGKIVILQ